MMKEENKKKPYLIIFKKVDVEDKPLMAANDNQKEGIIKKINDLEQLADDSRVNFQVIDVNESNLGLMRKWKIKESAADKRPVLLVALGGQGKTFSGPLSTTKAANYLKQILPKKDQAAAAPGQPAGAQPAKPK